MARELRSVSSAKPIAGNQDAGGGDTFHRAQRGRIASGPCHAIGQYFATPAGDQNSPSVISAYSTPPKRADTIFLDVDVYADAQRKAIAF